MGEVTEADHVLMKRGLYYRPNGNGYTGLKCEAGLYPRSYALGLDGVVALPVADAPEFAPSCWEQTKVTHLQAALTTAQAENEALRNALHDAICMIGHAMPMDTTVLAGRRLVALEVWQAGYDLLNPKHNKDAT